MLVEETSEPVYSHLTIRIVSVIPPDQCCHNDTFYSSFYWSCYIFKAYYLCNTDTLLVSINMIVTNVQLHCLAFQSSKPKRTGRLIMRPFLVLGNRSFSGPAVGRVVSSSCTQLPSSCFGVVTLILLSFFKKVWLNMSSASSFMSMMVLLVTGDEVFN